MQILVLFQEQDDPLHLGPGETYVEALIVEGKHVLQGIGRAVMEIWRACSQSAQGRHLEFADVIELAGAQRQPGIGRGDLSAIALAAEGVIREIA